MGEYEWKRGVVDGGMGVTVNSNMRAIGGTPAHEKNHFGLSFSIMARFSLIFLLENLKIQPKTDKFS